MSMVVTTLDSSAPSILRRYTVDDAMQVQIDKAASCGRCYTHGRIYDRRCVCVKLLNVRARSEVRKVSALAGISKVGDVVRTLTRLVAWNRSARDRPGFVQAEQR